MSNDISLTGVWLTGLTTDYNLSGVMTKDNFQRLQDWLTATELEWANKNKYEYIVAVRLSPVKLDRFASAPRGIQIGGKFPSNVQTYFIQGEPNTPVLDLGYLYIPFKQYEGYNLNSFWNYSPFTSIDIYLPFVGFVQVNATEVMGKAIRIRYPFDVQTGNATATLSIDDRIILSREARLFIDIPIGSSNAQQAFTNQILTGASIIGGLASGSANLSNIASYTSQWVNASQIHVDKGTIGTPLNAVLNPLEPFAVIKRSKPISDTLYPSLFGKPLCVTTELSALSGLTIVGDVHLEGMGNATQTEIDEIEALLKSGVIL